jgi:hypothetical protein
MRKLIIILALALACLPGIASADVDCRGNNQFNGGHDGPPKHQQNVCTK